MIPIHKSGSKRLSRNPRPGSIIAPPVSSLSSAWSPKDRPVSPSEGWPGAAIVFYAYIGFDSVSTHAVEGDDFDRQRRRSIGSVVAAAHSRGAGEYRHATGIRHRMRRSADHATARARRAQAVPLPARAADSDSRQANKRKAAQTPGL